MKLSFPKPDAGSLKEQMGTVSTRKGGYSVVLSLAVTAIVVFACLMLELFPSNVKKIDISNNSIYSVSSITTDLVGSLDKDVKLIVVANTKDAIDSRIMRLLEVYDKLSDHLSYVVVDSVQNPSILEKYDNQTITAVCDETGREMSTTFGDIIKYDKEYYYKTGLYVENEFDGEGQLTKLIDFVVSDSSSKAYRLTGHGETELLETVLSSIDKLNVTLSDLNLLTDGGAVPADCEVLVINAPSSDISQDELEMIEKYIGNGGTVMFLFMETSKENMPNFWRLAQDYGYEFTEGYIAEGDRYYNNPYYLIPYIQFASGITNDYYESSELAMVVNSKGFRKTETAPANVKYREFLTTTTNAFEDSYDENGELQLINGGEFLLGSASIVSNSNGSTGNFILLSAQILNKEAVTSISSLLNIDLFLSAFSWQIKSVSHISIAAKSLSTTYNAITNGSVMGIVFIAVIPLLIIGAGLFVWIRRRRA